MSIIQTHKRKIIGAGIVGGSFYFFNPLRTPGVQNIEKRYTSGGGSPNHLPGTATKRGHSNQVQGNQEGHHGAGTPYWEEKMGEQKGTAAQETEMQKLVKKQHYPGNGKGDDKGLK